MRRTRVVLALVLTAGMVALAIPLAAQGDAFTARLGWVPISGAERANVTGKGTVSATLSGTRLTLTGSYEGLAAPATEARLHRGIAKGARGPAIGDLTITKGMSGKISGAVDLNAAQVEDLRAGRLYVQVHSEKGVAPDGSNLWGWLLK